MKKQNWLVQGIPLVAAAAAPLAAAGAQTLSSRGRSHKPVVISHQSQDQAHKHLDLTSFGAFSLGELMGVESPVSEARKPSTTFPRLSRHKLNLS